MFSFKKGLTRVGLVLLMMLLFVGVITQKPQKTKSYGEISGLTAAVADSTKSATTTYTVSFTIQHALPQWDGRINVQILDPSGSSSSGSWLSNNPNFNSATVASGTSPSSIVYHYSYWNGAAFYVNQAVAAGTTITLKIGNVVNPAQGGYYYAHVWTSNYYTDLDGSSNWGGDYNSSYFEIGSNTNVIGTIKDSEGAGVANANVSINYYSGSSYAYYSAYTDKNGVYGIGDVAAGTYTFSVWGPSVYGSNKAYFPPPSSSITVAASGVVTKNASFLAATKTLSGKVSLTTSSGTAITDAYVSAYNTSGNGYISGTVDSGGNYSFTVTGGTWSVSIGPNTWPANWVYSYSDSDRVSFADDSTQESKTKDFVVDAVNSYVSGTIKKSDGSIPAQWSTGLSFSNSKNNWFSANVDSYGSFTARVSAGTYKANGWTSDSTVSFPQIANFTLNDNETKNLGTITLLDKTDTISGTVIDNFGAAVSGVSISAWKEDPWDWSNTTSDSSGNYQLKVTPGIWKVSAWPQWNSGYVYSGDPKSVTVVSGVTSTLNYTFQKATATINGSITDSDGNILSSINSWANASDGSKGWGNVGAEIKAGTFSLKVPAGTWDINTYIYGSDYGSPDPQTITIADYETKSVTLVAAKNDATISGTVYDDQGNKVTGKWMSLYATKGKYGAWMNANLNQSDGTYSIKLSAGTWKVGWWIDKNTGYSSGDGEDSTVAVASGETKTLDIILKKADSQISGKVTKSDGSVMKWAWITADSRDPNQKRSADTMYTMNGASSDESGNYQLKLPAGTYWVGGSMWSGSGYINPKRQKITVDADHPATVDLVFRTADATISGTVKNGETTSAYITAWSEDGGYSDTNSTNVGAYTLNVSSGTKWHVRASKLVDKDVYKSSEYIVDLTDTTSVALDIKLDKQSYVIPNTVTVSFDPTKQQVIRVDDGTTITIPANVLATSGTITATITPDATLPEESTAKPIRYGYNITFVDDSGTEITSFAGNITIEFAYVTDALAENHLMSADELQQAYYDETTGTWKTLSSCTVNTTENKVVCQVNHATTFALVSAADTTPPAAPTEQGAVGIGSTIRLSWKNPVDSDFNGVKIYRSTVDGALGDLITTTDKTAVSYDNTAVQSGTSYYYTIKAVDASGNLSANTAQLASTITVTTLPLTGESVVLLLLAIGGLAIGAVIATRRNLINRISQRSSTL